MNTNLNEVAGHAQTLAKQYRAVLAVSDALKEIGNLQDFASAADAANKKAHEELADVTAKLEKQRMEAVNLTIHVETLFQKEAAAKGRIETLERQAAADHAARMEGYARDQADAQAAVDALKAELDALRKRLKVE